MPSSSVYMRLSVLLIAIFLNTSPSWALPANSCYSVFQKVGINPFGFVESEADKQRAQQLMIDGSESLSRTIVLGKNLLLRLRSEKVSRLAQKNFQEATDFILENYNELPLNNSTATELNMILTVGLVGDNFLGDSFYRSKGVLPEQLDHFIGSSPRDFYVWLESGQAKRIFRTSPVLFAEILHNSYVANDAFPDGNGRTARLMADLALLKAGMGPAHYTDMNTYFERGNARSPVSRFFRRIYFEEAVRAGQRALREFN